MDEDTITDLKQFISGLLDQHSERLKTELKDELGAEFRTELGRVEQKLDDFIDFVSEAIHIANETSGKGLKDHERRIVRLEQKTGLA